nr:division/cell wall cluster transcriptional repressor MraZ [Lachnospiraceae bacterium]
MFMGEYNHTIDIKGRLIVPTKFREQLGEAFVIAKGNDGCLAIYTNEAWETFMKKIQALPANKDI